MPPKGVPWKIGMWLSLVEYLNGVQVVVGSNPAIPTN
jgi:hypothetical protein